MAEGRGNPRIFELIEGAPKVNKDPTSPTIWAWPEVVDMLKIAGQPVPGPWPPHQVPRPDPAPEEIPIAVPEKRQPSSQRPRNLKADDTVFGVEYTEEPAGRRAAANGRDRIRDVPRGSANHPLESASEVSNTQGRTA